MKRLATLAGMAALMISACSGAASPAATQPSVAPMATAPMTTAPAATSRAMISPTAAPVTAEVTFDGETCSYAGPAVVEDGTTIVWVFENTPAAIEKATEKGAKSIGSELVVIPVAEGTTWETFLAESPPEGTKGDWPPAPAYLLVDSTEVGYGPSAKISAVADGHSFVVMCNVYWDYDTGTPFAMYHGAFVEVLKG